MTLHIIDIVGVHKIVQLCILDIVITMKRISLFLPHNSICSSLLCVIVFACPSYIDVGNALKCIPWAIQYFDCQMYIDISFKFN